MSKYPLPDLQPCTSKALGKLSTVLARAFFDYPEMCYYFPHPRTRLRDARWLCHTLLRVAYDLGKIYSDPQARSCLALLPPGVKPPSNLRYALAGYWQFPLRYGPRTTRKIIRYNELVDSTHAKLLAGREHYYLWMLAVDPQAQGQGLGRQLLQPLCKAADAAGLPIFLETHLESNLPYYQRYGFSSPGTVQPAGHIPFWPMLREPAAPPQRPE